MPCRGKHHAANRKAAPVGFNIDADIDITPRQGACKAHGHVCRSAIAKPTIGPCKRIDASGVSHTGSGLAADKANPWSTPQLQVL